jgi:hypothetical protein
MRIGSAADPDCLNRQVSVMRPVNFDASTRL